MILWMMNAIPPSHKKGMYYNMYMLDTNICIFAIKKRPEKVLARLQTHKPSEICISSITYAELCHGVEKSQAKARNRLALTLFLSAINIMPFDELAANEYGKVRAALEANGTPIGPLDTQIAAHAKALNITLVTNNTREFQRVEGLHIEDWA